MISNSRLSQLRQHIETCIKFKPAAEELRVVGVFLIMILALFLNSCIAHSGFPEPIFSLPKGSPQAGRAAFAKFSCHSCHQVAGENFPKPVAEPPVPVSFGSASDLRSLPIYRMRAQLAESIVNPSHRVSPFLKNVRSGQGSRMADYTEVMTVRELIDLVAFLQEVYTSTRK